jgi:hypothetical protein
LLAQSFETVAELLSGRDPADLDATLVANVRLFLRGYARRTGLAHGGG